MDMRRIKRINKWIAVHVLIVCCLSGCDKAERFDQSIETPEDSRVEIQGDSTDTETESNKTYEEKNTTLDYIDRYVYVGCVTEAPWPAAQIIRNRTELLDYCDSKRNNFNFYFEQNGSESFVSEIEVYDEQWFEQSMLLLMPIASPNTGYNHKVTAVSIRTGDGTEDMLNVQMECRKPEVGNDAVEVKYLILEILDTSVVKNMKINIEVIDCSTP